MAARATKTKATGKKPGGKPPEPPAQGPLPSDQINLTDEESRIMPIAGGGFDQCYNAQAAVATGSLPVVASKVVQAPNDKQQLEPMLGVLQNLPDAIGQPDTLLADNGYFSVANVAARQAAGIEPMRFRQFLLRGIDNVQGEWSLGYSARNVLRGREAMFFSDGLAVPEVEGSMVELHRAKAGKPLLPPPALPRRAAAAARLQLNLDSQRNSHAVCRASLA